MNTFVNSINNQTTRTQNGMVTNVSSGNEVLNLFYAAGASRGRDLTGLFSAAYATNRELALRVALWLRDARGGAGEREAFRKILAYLANTNVNDAAILIERAPELGRWDDIFEYVDHPQLGDVVTTLIAAGLAQGNGLLAKWLPREKSAKRSLANRIRTALNLSPKEYRKLLASLTTVVETQMCAKNWEGINFSHVPSVAAARYRKAFYRNATESFESYVASLVKNDGTAKVNASAVFPHDVLKSVITNILWRDVRGDQVLNATERNFIIAQWEAMTNSVGSSSAIPIIDVSGSMNVLVGGSARAIDVAVSLGLYMADKNTGPFHGVVVNFSAKSEVHQLHGTVINKIEQLSSKMGSSWGMNTNLHAAFKGILEIAKSGNVPAEDMPKSLVIFSDMQFDQCVRYDDLAIEMIKRQYEEAGYTVPNVVFWNLHASAGVPVKVNDKGVALASGYSPNLMKIMLAGDYEQFTPYSMMMAAIGGDRYKI